MRVLSWNLLRRRGAGAEDIRRLVEAHRPDLVLLQEATAHIDPLPDVLGGSYARREMEGRGHGPAAWSLRPFTAEPVPLPPATRLDLPVPVRPRLTRRIALVVQLDGVEIANVHLDHGQLANRRALRHLLNHPRFNWSSQRLGAPPAAPRQAPRPAFSSSGPCAACH